MIVATEIIDHHGRSYGAGIQQAYGHLRKRGRPQPLWSVRDETAYFLLCGISRDDVEYILGTFQGISKEDEAQGVGAKAANSSWKPLTASIPDTNHRPFVPFHHAPLCVFAVSHLRV